MLLPGERKEGSDRFAKLEGTTLQRARQARIARLERLHPGLVGKLEAPGVVRQLSEDRAVPFCARAGCKKHGHAAGDPHCDECDAFGHAGFAHCDECGELWCDGECRWSEGHVNPAGCGGCDG